MQIIGLVVCVEPNRKNFEQLVAHLREMAVVGTLSWISFVNRSRSAQDDFRKLQFDSYGINVSIVESKLSPLGFVLFCFVFCDTSFSLFGCASQMHT